MRAKEQLLARASKDADRSRKTSRLAEPLAFEISARAEHGTAPTSLPAELVARLQIKSRRAAAKPLTTLATRLALSKSARVAFALKNLVSAHNTQTTRMRRARNLKAAVYNRARAGAALAKHHTQSVTNVAKHFNARVPAAALRRAAADASRRKAAARRSLRAVAAAGRRATRLLNTSVNLPEAKRAGIFFARREAADAARLSRARSGLLRSLVVAMKGTELLVHKAARAHMASVPYGTPAKLTEAGGVVFKRPAGNSLNGAKLEGFAAQRDSLNGAKPEAVAAVNARDSLKKRHLAARPEAYARVAIHLPNTPGATRAQLSITVASLAGEAAAELEVEAGPNLGAAIQAQNEAQAAVKAGDMSVLTDSELRAMHALATASLSSTASEDWQMVDGPSSAC